MLRYLLRTDGVEFEVSRRPVPRFDDRGVQKIDSVTGLPQYAVEVTAFTNEEDGSAVLSVVVSSRQAPDLVWRQPVEVIDLEMIPWANKTRTGEIRQGVAFKAAEIRPVGGQLSAVPDAA